jgi:hypothetical protein
MVYLRSIAWKTQMAIDGPVFIVLYRWKLKDGLEGSLVDAWSRISQLLRDERESLGSRLHRGADGVWYSYAQWPSAAARALAFASASIDPHASNRMRAAVAEEFAEVVLEPVADLFGSSVKIVGEPWLRKLPKYMK